MANSKALPWTSQPYEPDKNTWPELRGSGILPFIHSVHLVHSVH